MLTWWAAIAAQAAPLDPGAYTPLAAILDPSEPVEIDTDSISISADGVVYTGVLDGEVAVFAFSEVSLDQPLSATGSRPFALLSLGAMTLSSTIEASASGSRAGPGGYDGGTNRGGEAGKGIASGGGGISAGSGAGGGAHGGAGGASSDGVQGGIPYGDLEQQLTGGSGGGKSNDDTSELFGEENGAGGGGGGGIELGALGAVHLAATAAVFADGAAGASDDRHGGGGGGGGGILIHGNGGACEGGLSARGGEGGEGDTDFFDPVAGEDGGGGGGGRITVLGLDNPCEADVGAGARPDGTTAGNGVRRFVELRDWDSDGDGWTIADGDCDESDPEVHPGAEEILDDGLDNDCDGVWAETVDTGGSTSAPEPPAGTSPDLRDRSPVIGGGHADSAGCGCALVDRAGARRWPAGLPALVSALGLAIRRRRAPRPAAAAPPAPCPTPGSARPGSSPPRGW